MSLSEFHYFPLLPTELQNSVWELYEADAPSVRHHFRTPLSRDGSVYLATTKGTKAIADTFAHPDDPDRTEVPVPAVAPKYKIKLSKSNGAAVCRPTGQESTLTTFSTSQPVRRLPHGTSVWMNFRVDNFCFFPVAGLHFTGYFSYLQKDDNFTLPNSLEFNRSHWFFSVENVEIFVEDPDKQLTEFDQRVLVGHPALKSITIILRVVDVVCPMRQYFHQSRIDAVLVPQRLSLHSLVDIVNEFEEVDESLASLIHGLMTLAAPEPDAPHQCRIETQVIPKYLEMGKAIQDLVRTNPLPVKVEIMVEHCEGLKPHAIQSGILNQD
jgi:hypothetical protein